MHHLARLSLAQRSLVALATVILTAAGLFSMVSLKQELIPSLEVPQASVVSTYPGSSPEIVDEQVSQPIETALSGLDDLESITATSSTGVSQLNVAFEFGTDIGEMQAKIEQVVSGLGSQLPDAVSSRVLAGSSADFPVLYLAVSSDGR